MPEAIKVLGQSDPAATTLTALYTVPAATEAVVSTITICNRTAGTIEARVAVAPAGAADTPAHYLLYDVKIPKNDYLFATIGMTLEATDVVRVYASASGLSFSLFGTEVT